MTINPEHLSEAICMYVGGCQVEDILLKFPSIRYQYRNFLKEVEEAGHPTRGRGNRSIRQPDTRLPEIIHMIRAGATLEECGARFGISKERVRQITAKAGFSERSYSKGGTQGRKRKEAKKLMKQARKEEREIFLKEVLDDYQKTHSTIVTARNFGISQANVALMAKRAGVSRPRGRFSDVNKQRMLTSRHRRWQKETEV